MTFVQHTGISDREDYLVDPVKRHVMDVHLTLHVPVRPQDNQRVAVEDIDRWSSGTRGSCRAHFAQIRHWLLEHPDAHFRSGYFGTDRSLI
jgi:hypothetical protein